MYIGDLGFAHRHRHAALQVVLATTGRVRLRDRTGALWHGSAALIPAGAEHEIAGRATGLLAWIDADGQLGQALTARIRGTGRPVDAVTAWADAAQPLLDAIPATDTSIEVIDRILSALAEEAPLDQPPMHPALRQAVTVLPAMLDRPVHLEQIARAVGLSASRLGHLFSAELSLPFRAYVRWARLQRAIDQARQGMTLTEAAHAAGFADSAHLTRVCHEMFGLAPSFLARGVHWADPQP